jgi:hypothetical protein
MHLLTLLGQILDPPKESPTPAAPMTPPIDEGNWGVALIIAFLATALIVWVVCSPVRRDMTE